MGVIVPLRKALGVSFAALSAMALVGAAGPAKAIVFLQSVQGDGVNSGDGADTWINPTPNTADQNIAYPLNNAISWGTDGIITTEIEKSRLTYNGITYGGQGLQLPAAAVDLGELLHNNAPIDSGSAISNVTLVLDFRFFSSVTNSTFDEILNVQVAINETPNNPPGGTCPNGGDPPCPDVITLTPIGNRFIDIPGSTEFLVFTPVFLVDGQPQNSILTLEDDINSFDFAGSFAVAPSPAPVGGIALLSIFSGKFRKLRKRLQEHNEVQV